MKVKAYKIESQISLSVWQCYNASYDSKHLCIRRGYLGASRTLINGEPPLRQPICLKETSLDEEEGTQVTDEEQQAENREGSYSFLNVRNRLPLLLSF